MGLKSGTRVLIPILPQVCLTFVSIPLTKTYEEDIHHKGFFLFLFFAGAIKWDQKGRAVNVLPGSQRPPSVSLSIAGPSTC